MDIVEKIKGLRKKIFESSNPLITIFGAPILLMAMLILITTVSISWLLFRPLFNEEAIYRIIKKNPNLTYFLKP
jgi:hypothetical protein